MVKTQNRYSEEFKARLVKRVCAPGGPSPYALASEVGVSRTALYSWVNEARGKVMKKKRAKAPSRRPMDWSAAEKLAAVVHCGGLDEEELGRYLRKEGLHEEHLQEWRQQCEQSLNPKAQAQRERDLKKDNQRLNRELIRKEKALAEAAALLVLSKKMRAFWGEEGENT